MCMSLWNKETMQATTVTYKTNAASPRVRTEDERLSITAAAPHRLALSKLSPKLARPPPVTQPPASAHDGPHHRKQASQPAVMQSVPAPLPYRAPHNLPTYHRNSISLQASAAPPFVPAEHETHGRWAGMTGASSAARPPAPSREHVAVASPGWQQRAEPRAPSRPV